MCSYNFWTIVASSAVVSTLISSGISILIVWLKHRHEYKKLIIDRRMVAYEDVEHILESISTDHENKIKILSGDFNDYKELKYFLSKTISKSYLLSKEMTDKLMELSLNLNTHDNRTQANFEELVVNEEMRKDIVLIRFSMSQILKDDYKKLHKI